MGVMGDRSCPELKDVIHCYDCSVYAAAGDALLERDPPPDYIHEWTHILSEPTPAADVSSSKGAIVPAAAVMTIMIFRLGSQKLALPVRVLQEVTHPCFIQPLPHRSDQLFLGLVNVRGEILLCVSLSQLLNLESATNKITDAYAKRTQRMIVAGQREGKWVFPVDEVYGTHRFHLKELREPPVVITKAAESYTQGVIDWEDNKADHKVNYLDSDLLFYALNQKIS